MTTKLTFACAAWLLLQGLPQAPATGVVAGRVLDDTTRRPVAGAVVTLSAVASAGQPAIPAAQARRGVVVTNAEGRFVFRDVPPGTLALSATMNNYAPGATGRRRPGGPTSTFTLAADQHLTDADIRMWRLSAISGTLIDDRGEPAIGVSVWAMRRVLTPEGNAWSFTGGTVEATDDRGFFRLTGLTPGIYTVQVRSSTHTNSVAGVTAWRAASNASGPIVGGDPFRGRSREAMESGARNIERSGFEVDGWQVKTSIGGPQPLPGPNGTVLVHPTIYFGNTTSAADAMPITLAAGEDRAGVDLVLPLIVGQRISGTLSGPEGPAGGHGLRLNPAAGVSTTDAQGRFAFLGIPPGTYTLHAYRVPMDPTMLMRMTGQRPSPDAPPPATSLFTDVALTVGDSPVDGLSLMLAPGASLAGRVVFEGTGPRPTPEQIGRMTLALRAPDADAGSTTFDATGTFRTPGYASGRYLLNVTPPSTGWTLSSIRVRGMEVAGQALALEREDLGDIVITMTSTVMTLTGSVTPEDTATPPEATVVVMPTDVTAWIASGMSPRRVATTTTSVTGTYQLTIPLPGDYLVVAIPPDVAPDVTPEFAARYAAEAVRVSFAAGESKSQSLTLRRPR